MKRRWVSEIPVKSCSTVFRNPILMIFSKKIPHCARPASFQKLYLKAEIAPVRFAEFLRKITEILEQAYRTKQITRLALRQ